MKEPKNNTLKESSTKNRAKEASKRLFKKRIEEFDSAKQELLLKLYNKIIEEK